MGANIKAKTKIQRHRMVLANRKTTTKKIIKAKTQDMHKDFKIISTSTQNFII